MDRGGRAQEEGGEPTVAAKRIIYRACKACQFITDQTSCPRCGGETSREWQGMVAIADYTKSEIAKQMGITSNGTYALKVR